MQNNNNNKKSFFLDTNIIMDNVSNIFTLSEEGQNIIILDQTVLNELDSNKSGFETKNFNARKFNRVLSEGTVIESRHINDTAKAVIMDVFGTEVHLVVLNTYDTQVENSMNTFNDRKIVECAKKISMYYPGMMTVSNDIAFRNWAIIRGVTVEHMSSQDVEDDNRIFHYSYTGNFSVYDGVTFEKMSDQVKEQLDEDIPEYASSFEFVDATSGKPFYGIRDGSIISEIIDSKLTKQFFSPRNLEQKISSTLIFNPYVDLVVLSGRAGTGKNACATSAACAVMDKDDRFDKMVYIRKTVLSSDDDVGFLPGSLEEKMAGYLAPLYNTFENIVTHKYKKSKDINIEEKSQELMKTYNVTPMYMGHLRGSTISNAIVIIDEIQNMSKSDMQLIISRFGENVKCICLGSLHQIDSNFLTRYNCGLSHMLEQAGINKTINIKGVNLKNVIRSKFAEFADEAFSEQRDLI